MRYKERNEEKRAEYAEKISEIPAERIVYIDECGIDEHLTREYGKSPRGVPVYGEVSGKKFDRLNIIAGRRGNKIIAPGEYKGSTDHRLFETWFGGALLKEVPRGSFIVLDNAAFHRKKTLSALAKSGGCEVLFLPPYSPDLNPIEKLWANLKSFIKNHSKNFRSLSLAVSHYFNLV
jgi:transposase